MQPRWLDDGDILHRVDGHINPPLKECLLKFLQEKAFTPFGSKRDIKGTVTFCALPATVPVALTSSAPALAAKLTPFLPPVGGLSA